MAIHRVVLTYEDYLAMPDDGRRHEILDGEVAVTATPALTHQMIVGNSTGCSAATSNRGVSATCTSRRSR
jgi:hypothetical protein